MFKMKFKNLIKTKHTRGEKRRGRIKEKPNRTFKNSNYIYYDLKTYLRETGSCTQIWKLVNLKRSGV